MEHFDLDHKLRTDGEFRNKISTLTAKLQEYGEKRHTSSKQKKLYLDTLKNFLHTCRWNIALLIPYYFPKYLKGSPLSFENYPFSIEMYEIAPYTTTIIRGSRQIGKTTNITARDILTAQLLPGIQMMTITPKTEQIKTFANKLKDTEAQYRFFQSYTNYRNNLFYKEYPNLSTIKLTNVLTNASNIRGNTVDFFTIDEVQDFDLSMEVEVEEIQSASDFPNSIYSGTSLTVDSALETKWNASSRGTWTITCERCGKFNRPTPEGNVMDMIKPEGPCCVHCGALLNVRNGRWIHDSPEMLAAGYKGLHVPKIIIPALAENPFKWNRIYMQSRTVDRRSFYQEVLGIPTEEGEREITVKNLEDLCMLGSSSELQQKAQEGKYRYIVSGCDWGGSDYIQQHGTKLSYTVHVAMGITTDQKMDIVHMRRYSGMNYKDVAGDIMYNHRKLNGFAIGSDFGVGAQYNNYIREQMTPNRHFILNYVGPSAAIFSAPAGPHMFNQYSVNKTETITMLFEALKAARIRCYNWQEASIMLNDCLNLMRAPHETPSGSTTLRYIRHGSKSDDTLHAINFAYIVCRLILGEPLFEDRSLGLHLNEMLATQNIDPLGGNYYVQG